ncbi:MAG: hypothetical protein IPN34_06905 [Planctomycetes bacterium]|nr:hypothetical protein [Planctomycetota bacterium]
MHQRSRIGFALLLGLLVSTPRASALQDPPAATAPSASSAPSTSAPSSDGEKRARALLAEAIAKQLGHVRDHVLRSFQTEISLVDQRQGNVEARLSIAFTAGSIPAQDGIKIRTRLGDEVETSRWGAQYWISRKSQPLPIPMTQAEFQKDKADLRRYAKMCRTLMYAFSLAGLAHSLESPNAQQDLDVDWFDGGKRRMAFVIAGFSTEIGGLLADSSGEKAPSPGGEKGFDPLGLPSAEKGERAEVRLYFNAAFELERIDVRRATAAPEAAWQAYRFLEFGLKDIGERRHVKAPSVFHIYEGLPQSGSRLDHVIQVRLTTLKLNPKQPLLDETYFKNRGF